MRILALDTTSAFGSIALWEDGAIVEEVPLHSPDGFGHVLFDHLRRILDRHDWAIDSIDRFAAASGPGSFTGVRVGVAAVKGLAEATGRSAVGVSNLKALAACGTAAVRGVVMDARRGEVYGAVYSRDLHIVVPEAVLPFRSWVEHLPADTGEILSPDFSPFRAAFTPAIPINEQPAIAGAVARIASDHECDPAAIDANYVRRSDAELNWTDA